MWTQREMKAFLLFAVEGATHNILLDFAIVKAVFADLCAEEVARRIALKNADAADSLPVLASEPAVPVSEQPASETEPAEELRIDDEIEDKENVENIDQSKENVEKKDIAGKKENVTKEINHMAPEFKSDVWA